MRLPSITLPSFGLGDRFDAGQTRRVALYALYTLVLFCVFLIVNFPYRALVERALDQVQMEPLHVDVAAARFAWWRGFELGGVRLIDHDLGREPLFEVSRAYLTPGWAGLLRGRLSTADLDANAYAGRMRWRWSEGSDVARVQGRLDRLQLARHRGLASLFDQGQISGLLSGVVDVELRKGDSAAAKAEGELQLAGLAGTDLVYRGMPVLDLAFDEVTAKFTLQGGRLEIEELNAVGPDLTVTATGQVGLRQPIQDSVLNLRASVEAAEDARPEVKGLVSLLPKPKGGRANAPIPIVGTLAKPRLR